VEILEVSTSEMADVVKIEDDYGKAEKVWFFVHDDTNIVIISLIRKEDEL
jgi:hypothetical protein